MSGFAQLLRGGSIVAIELALCATAGGAAAAFLWSVAVPHGPTGASPVLASSHSTRPTLSLLARQTDPFRRGAAASAPSSAGDIVLHATRAGAEGSGSAILSFAGAAQSAFRSGDEIAPGVRLTHVGSDHIEIDRGGQRERIAFLGTASSIGVAAPSPLVTSPHSTPAVDLAALGFRAATRDGQTIGYELVQADAIFDSLGVEPGDILVSVNGQKIDETSLATHRAALLAGGPAQLTLERAGSIRTIQLGTPRQ